MAAASARLAERQIDTLPAGQCVLTVRQRGYAVKGQPGRAAPYHDVAMLEPVPARSVAALRSAEQEDGGQPQRNRHDGAAEIGLVPVLMQRHFCAGLVAIDQTGVRGEPAEARAIGGLLRKLA